MDNTLATLEAVRTAINTYQLLPAQGFVVVGVSGGADSVCLLHILKQLCAPDGDFPKVNLHVAHLDHKIRGEAGQADAQFVADLAAQWALACTIGHEDVPVLARQERRSLEDAARRARYRFLRQVAQEIGAASIAVAHHADDQAETLLMHWLRGSGLAGLSGMRPREHDIIRPLLFVNRADILAYCAYYGLSFREDTSNQDRRFLRNRIRHDLLPVLEQYNEHLRATLLRNAEVLAEEDHYIESQVDACWPQVICHEETSRLEGSVSAYRSSPVAIRRRLVRRMGLRTSGGEVSLELRHCEAVDALLLRPVGSGTLHLPGNLAVQRVYDRFLFGALKKDEGRSHLGISSIEPISRVPLSIPGEANLPESRWLVRAFVLNYQTTIPPGYERGDAKRGYMDLDAVQPYLPLALRARRPGDRFRTLGLKTEKKLQDVLVNAKIPRVERDQLPLVCGADDTILWVAGYQIADQVKLTPETRHALVLELEALSDKRL
jgi:tRNA(Ile)-lysidine synthase